MKKKIELKFIIIVKLHKYAYYYGCSYDINIRILLNLKTSSLLYNILYLITINKMYLLSIILIDNLPTLLLAMAYIF